MEWVGIADVLKIITDRVLLVIMIKNLYLYGDSLSNSYFLCTLKGIL